MNVLVMCWINCLIIQLISILKITDACHRDQESSVYQSTTLVQTETSQQLSAKYPEIIC